MSAARKDLLIGVDLGGTKLAAGLIRQGNLEKTAHLPVHARTEDPQDIIDLIYSIIDDLSDQKVAGIGVGVPGPVDKVEGIVFDVHNIPSWKEVPLGKLLETRYGVPVLLDNDSNCFALGEYQFGKFAGTRDFVGVTLGTGMGSGIIKNGTLMPDANGCSGEFGVIPYLDGIYENYSSGMFFTNKYGQSARMIAGEASRGKQWAIDAFEIYGMHLGNAIKTIKMAVDPAMIILGGSLANARKLFEEAMWKSIQQFSFPSGLRNFEVNFSETPHIAILGAAALHLNQ